MTTQVLIPPLSQTTDTLTFVQWYKQEGELVHAGEPLFVVETDKATLDVEAPASGILRQVTAQPGDQVPTLTAIAVIAPARPLASPRARRLASMEGVPLEQLQGTGPAGAIVEADVRAFLERMPQRGPEIHRPEAKPGVTAPGGREVESPTAGEPGPRPEPAITPVARRRAEEAGLAWQQLAGSGAGGRVTRQDVEQALADRELAKHPETPSAVAVPVAPGQEPLAVPSEPAPTASDVLDAIPMKGIRELIAQRMQASHLQTAPVTLTAETDATGLVEMRQRLAARQVSVSYNDILLAILGKALRQHPRLNASLDGETIQLWEPIHVGLAVDTDRGLLVPVVRHVDQKGLAQIARETRDLAERARSGKVLPDELRGSTFTLTNLGMFGVDAFTPLINLPETAILGVGRIQHRPVWVEDHVEGRPMAWLSMTFDHRLVDGGLAARFLQEVVRLVEQPILLLA
jgi:pyruvate dehydrogenase E2 component (dihydrolipoamide acetyltransferase)